MQNYFNWFIESESPFAFDDFRKVDGFPSSVCFVGPLFLAFVLFIFRVLFCSIVCLLASPKRRRIDNNRVARPDRVLRARPVSLDAQGRLSSLGVPIRRSLLSGRALRAARAGLGALLAQFRARRDRPDNPGRPWGPNFRAPPAFRVNRGSLFGLVPRKCRDPRSGLAVRISRACRGTLVRVDPVALATRRLVPKVGLSKRMRKFHADHLPYIRDPSFRTKNNSFSFYQST